MWYLEKEVSFSAAHHLQNYQGKCKFTHGHNWNVIVYCKGNKLDSAGILVDFGVIKQLVHDLDHTCLNDIVPFNPTAENIAKYLCEKIPYCYKVMVEESTGSRCIYTEEVKDV